MSSRNVRYTVGREIQEDTGLIFEMPWASSKNFTRFLRSRPSRIFNSLCCRRERGSANQVWIMTNIQIGSGRMKNRSARSWWLHLWGRCLWTIRFRQEAYRQWRPRGSVEARRQLGLWCWGQDYIGIISVGVTVADRSNKAVDDDLKNASTSQASDTGSLRNAPSISQIHSNDNKVPHYSQCLRQVQLLHFSNAALDIQEADALLILIDDQ